MTGQGPHISFQINFSFLQIQYLCILSLLAHMQNIEYRCVLAEVSPMSPEQTLNYNSNTFFFFSSRSLCMFFNSVMHASPPGNCFCVLQAAKAAHFK